MADFDWEAYYAEQDERMNLPDEDTDEFIKRMSLLRQSEMFDGDASLRMPQALATSSSRDGAPNQDQASVPSVSETTTKDLFGGATTIKRKQSDISQEEGVSKRKRLRGQDNVQNHEAPSSPSDKELSHVMSSRTPSSNVLEQPVSFAVEMYDASGPQVKPGSEASTSNEVPSSSENQCMEKDSISRESSTSFNLNASAVKRKSSDSQLGPAMKRSKTLLQEESSTGIPTSDNDEPASDFEMLEPIDSFTVPSQLMTSRTKSDPVRNKLPSSPSKIRNERRGQKGCSPQPPPQSATTNASPITSFSKPFLSPKKNVAAQRVEPISLAKHPQLHLQPLYEVGFARPKAKSKITPPTTIHTSNPPTSPIEEISVVLPHGAFEHQSKNRMAESTTSNLYLEVKERIAKHSTTKQRDRLLKRGGSKMTAPTDESSIIYVSSSPSSRASSPAPVMGSGITVTSKRDQKKPKQPAEKRKGKKEKPQPMTPTEYARSLNEKLVAAASNAADSSTSKPKKRTPVKFLEGKYIFYTGGDMKHASEMTRGRMDLVFFSHFFSCVSHCMFQFQIVKHGGNLLPKYDPKVTTHIITDALMRPTLRALGLKALKDVPDHIPTVKWSWVLTVLGRTTLTKEEIDAKLREVWMHAAFNERMDAGYTPYVPTTLPFFRNKGKEKAVTTNHDEGPIESGDQRRSDNTSASVIQPTDTLQIEEAADWIRHPGVYSSPLTSSRQLQASTSKLIPNSHDNDNENDENDHADPLAQFYGKARAQQKLKEEGWSSVGELDIDDSDGGESDDAFPRPIGAIPKRGWTCDNKEVQRTTDCPNQDIVDKLTELMGLHKSKMGDEDHWRAFSYSKSIRALKNYPHRIKNYAEARSVRGVGEKTARKIEEILQTGELRRIRYEKTEDVEVSRLFQGIYGVGQSIAHQWYLAGCRTLDDVRSGKGGVKLSAAQEIGLRFYDDINDRMPRSEAKAIFDLIKPIALSIDPNLFIEIMGSYRRGKADCGDIDILITRPTHDGKTHRHIMSRLLRELHNVGILTEDLALPEDPDDLEVTYRGLCHLPNIAGSRRRRIDFLSVPWASRGAALLYYTGDDIFNRAIRLKANVLGYSLNQKGLFGNVVRNPRDRRVKLEAGILIASETEEEIFKILGVPWQEPHERVRG